MVKNLIEVVFGNINNLFKLCSFVIVDKAERRLALDRQLYRGSGVMVTHLLWEQELQFKSDFFYHVLE